MTDMHEYGTFEEFFAVENGKHECLICDEVVTEENSPVGVMVVDCGNCGDNHVVHADCMGIMRLLETIFGISNVSKEQAKAAARLKIAMQS